VEELPFVVSVVAFVSAVAFLSAVLVYFGLGVGSTVAYAAYFAAGYRDLNL